jgi:hypothetical protein
MQGPIPDDVRILVRFGSGEEEFAAEAPNDKPTVVFCTIHWMGDAAPNASPEVGGGGLDASDEDVVRVGEPNMEAGLRDGQLQIEKVVCDLWTHGAATVTVQASGYPKVERELSADRDECGIVQKEEQITLEHAD